MKIYNSFLELVGNTPMVRLNRLKATLGLHADLLVKLEMYNPSGSVKDRIALAMIEQAEADGLLKPGALIIEPTSGNTGIGLAMVGAAKGYQTLLVMPETMSIERRKIMKSLGAQLVLTEGAKGMKGAIAKAYELEASNPGSFVPWQFDNLVNPRTHYQTTGPEIMAQTDGLLDAFVAGVGTGGTISGTGKYLKEKNPAIRIVAVEPAKSSVLSGNAPGPHAIQGIGAGFIPKTLDTSIYDEVITIENETAFETARTLAKTEGILVGISSGAALAAAIDLARRPDYVKKTIVVLLPDTGERYLSTALFEAE